MKRWSGHWDIDTIFSCRILNREYSAEWRRLSLPWRLCLFSSLVSYYCCGISWTTKRGVFFRSRVSSPWCSLWCHYRTAFSSFLSISALHFLFQIWRIFTCRGFTPASPLWVPWYSYVSFPTLPSFQFNFPILNKPKFYHALRLTTLTWWIYRSIDWLMDWLILPLIDWLIDWLIHWSIDWSIDRLIDWLIFVFYFTLFSVATPYGYAQMFSIVGSLVKRPLVGDAIWFLSTWNLSGPNKFYPSSKMWNGKLSRDQNFRFLPRLLECFTCKSEVYCEISVRQLSSVCRA